MRKFAKIMLIALGFGLVTAMVGFLTSRSTTAQFPPPRASDDEHHGIVPVKVTNTPLPVQGSVNASVTGTVNASQNGAWSVGVNNFPPTQLVSFNGAQPVSFSNTATTPVFNRDVDNGTNPFQQHLVLDNGFVNPTFPGTGCTLTQCQANFDIPAGMRLVVEDVTARVQGASGQKYIADVIVNGDIAIWLVLNFQGSFSSIDIFTASQQMRVYADETTPSPAALVTSTNGGIFFADINISGYLVPKS